MKPPSLSPWGNRRGIALVSVLAVMILLTVLIVAFLLRAQIARNSSANYRATTATRLLSDTVVNLVEASINDATTYGSNGTVGQATGTAPYSWASQPGAIRVFDSSGSGSGATLGLQMIYRLYSAPSLTTPNISDLLNTANGNSVEIPATWANSPAAWVDLNAPITVADPSVGTTASFTVYPILDNRNPATPTQCVQMPGFFVNPVGTSTFPTAATTTLNQPYMPVQWLYVLQNGAIIAPDQPASGSTVTFNNVTPAANKPSSSNPIVGRIAYWTDDDTCKVNINTAAGSVSLRKDATSAHFITVNDGTAYNTGVFCVPQTVGLHAASSFPGTSWDTPRYGGSWDDLKLLAADQPVSGEYQRYPGHPATTILYYILNALGVSMPEIAIAPYNPYALGWSNTTPGPAGDANTTQTDGNKVYPYTSSLYGLLPRYNDNGGSQGGLCDTTHSGANSAANFNPTPNRSRLYTSLGELLYSTYASLAVPPVRTQNGAMGTGPPPVTPSSTPIAPFLTRQQIETGKFFLTTHSRAPEVTLFGTPRVTMWPVPDTSQKSSENATMAQTALDQLIAFCSKTDTGNGNAGNQYFFQRYDRASTTHDWVNEPRNQALYGYLQDLTSANIPGYYGPSTGSGLGGSFLDKYSGSNYKPTIANERDQILTEIIDYIRCTNLDDHSGTITQAQSYCSSGSCPAEVLPLTIASTASGSRTASTTSGLGRNPTLSEIGLDLICTADGTNNLAALNTAALNTNYGFSALTNIGSSVAYTTPQFVTTTPGATTTPAIPASTYTVSNTVPVSPVIGSANDPAYVSNLPVAQYLRDTNNNVVDIFGNSINLASGPANSAVNAPFPLNPTLSGGAYPVSPTDFANLTALPIGSKTLQAMLIFELASPMMNFDQMLSGSSGPNVNIQVTGLGNISFLTPQNIGQFAGGAQSINPFPSDSTRQLTVSPSGGVGVPNINGDGWLNGVSGSSGSQWGRMNQMSGLGGIMGFRYAMWSLLTVGTSPNQYTVNGRTNGWSGNAALSSQSASNPLVTGTSPNQSSTADTLGGPYPTLGTPATQFVHGTNIGQPYRFISNPFVVSAIPPVTASSTLPTIALGGSAPFIVNLAMEVTKGASTTAVPYQSFSVLFQTTPFLTPTLCAYGVSYNTGGSAPTKVYTHAPDWWGFDNRIGWATGTTAATGQSSTTETIGNGCVIRGDVATYNSSSIPISPGDVWGTAIGVGNASNPAPWSWAASGTGFGTPGNPVTNVAVVNGITTVTGGTSNAGATTPNTYGDVFRSLVPKDCDYRLTMAKSSVTADQSSNPDFVPTPLYSTNANLTDMLMEVGNSQCTPGVDVRGTLLNPATYASAPEISPKVPATFTYGPNPQVSFDWDSGLCGIPDGCYANKPDEGSNYVGAGVIPYINLGNEFSNSFSSYFTANRMVNSPVMFGSLPTGVAEGIPWRTLLFRPQLTVTNGGLRTDWTSTGPANNPTAVSSPAGPEDELLLDNFWMPVVQPYAISEPFSTAGKINMNAQILPFTYITRNTGLMALLGSELVARVPVVDAGIPTAGTGNGNPAAIYEGAGLWQTEDVTQSSLYGYVNVSHSIVPARLPLNLSTVNGTLRQFVVKFNSGDIFRSPAEICDIYLVPIDTLNTTYYTDWFNSSSTPPYTKADYSNLDSWYGSRGDFGLVGNNVRDHPYGDLYPRLTTKSNSYTVYYKVQSLKNPSANPAQWTEGVGVVTGEYRGSTSIERYLDPNNNNIPDYTVSANNPATTPSAPSLDNYYQWRVVSNTAFAP